MMSSRDSSGAMYSIDRSSNLRIKARASCPFLPVRRYFIPLYINLGSVTQYEEPMGKTGRDVKHSPVPVPQFRPHPFTKSLRILPDVHCNIKNLSASTLDTLFLRIRVLLVTESPRTPEDSHAYISLPFGSGIFLPRFLAVSIHSSIIT